MLLLLQLHARPLSAVIAELFELPEFGLIPLEDTNGIRPGRAVRTEAGVDSALSAGHSWESIRKNRAIAILS